MILLVVLIDGNSNYLFIVVIVVVDALDLLMKGYLMNISFITVYN